MIKSILESIMFNMPVAIIPSIMLIIYCQIHLYKGSDIKERVQGVILTFLVSYASFHFVDMLLYFLVGLVLTKFFIISPVWSLVYYVVDVIVCLTIYIGLFCAFIKYRNKKHPNDEIKPLFGVFVYAQYLVMIYCSMIFGDTAVQVSALIILVSVIFYLIFRKDFDNMSRIYPDNILCTENICLYFQALLTVVIYFQPQALSVSGSQVMGVSYYNWLRFLGVALYAFSVMIHKVIYMQSYHRYSAEQSMNTDKLTGLYSRRYLIENGQKLIEQARDSSIALIYINIRHFKNFNQNYGSAVADDILVNLANAIIEVFKDAQIIARTDADHFVVMTENLKGIELGLMQIRNKAVKEQEGVKLSLGVGIYVTDNFETDISTALDNAMIACYNAPKSNTVGLQYYDQEIDSEEKLNSYVAENVERALKEGMFKVYYQPIVDVKTEKFVSAEALLRWFDDKYGFISPAKFVPILEEQSLVYKVDCFVLEQVCKDQRQIIDLGRKPLPVSFNVSRKDFFATDIVSKIEKTIKKYDIPRSLLKVEVTESAVISNEAYISEQLERLSKLGYKIWMDDFGAGYSSLNSLGTFHVDGIKLDLLFLQNMTDTKRELMRGIVHTARLLGLEVLTEGVETAEQLELLRDIDCDLAQGYKFCMPMSFEEHLATNCKNI